MPTVVEYNGRKVGESVKWWAEHSSLSKSRLHCIHNVQLSRKCKECEK